MSSYKHIKKADYIEEATYTEHAKKFKQHLDFDIIIPQHLSWPLMISAHLLLVTASLAIVYHFYLLGCCATLVYFTSIWHWHKPIYSGWARPIDICAVFLALTVGTYTSFLLPLKYTIIWCSVVAFKMVFFTFNEVVFYFQVKVPNKIIENVLAIEPNKTIEEVACDFRSREAKYIAPWKLMYSHEATWPETIEREIALMRNAYVHMTCVHIIPGIMAVYCMVCGVNHCR